MMKKLLLSVSLVAFVVACGESAQDAPADTADETASGAAADAAGSSAADEQVLYALGTVIAGDIGVFDLTEAEFEHVAAGMRDVINGEASDVDLETIGPRIQSLANERQRAALDVERVAAAAFAAEIAAEPGAESSVSGLVFVPVEEGDGDYPAATDTVLVHYHGTLRDGTVFDSSVDRDQPIDFPLQGVIPCWTEGVQKIRVGGKAKLLCPSDIAYGDQGNRDIPGGAALLFEVELLEIL